MALMACFQPMDDDRLLSPLVGRSLLPPVTALRYLIDMVSIHMFFMQSHQERPMNVDIRSIHAFFMPCRQERLLNVNVCCFSTALPCISCNIDTMLLRTRSQLVPMLPVQSIISAIYPYSAGSSSAVITVICWICQRLVWLKSPC